MDLLVTALGYLFAASDLLVLYAAYWITSTLVRQRAADEHFSADLISDIAFWVALGAIVGGRLVYVAPYWPLYVRYPIDILRIQTGLSFHGALVGGFTVLFWLARSRQFSFARASDLIAPFLLMGIAVQRLGCLVRGDCFGAVAPEFLGAILPGPGLPRYPAELFEIMLVLGVAAVLLRWRSAPHRPGDLGFALLVAYPLIRAGVDLVHINLSGWPSPEQVASLVVSFFAAVAWYRARVSGRGAGLVTNRWAVFSPNRERESHGPTRMDGGTGRSVRKGADHAEVP